MNIDNCFKIGYVAKTHGLAGEVTINILPECPDLTSVENVFMQQGTTLVPYFIKAISIKSDKAYVRFEEVDTIEKASALKGTSIYLPKMERPKLLKGDFYSDEVVGFDVMQEDAPLGKITDVMVAGANRLLVLDYHGKEVLIPVTGPFIKSVNKTKKRVMVELPDGFLDI